MTWYLKVNDTFTNADTSTGSAGSVTGLPTMPSPGAANGWTDVAGGVAQISTNRAKLTGTYATGWVIRPTTEPGGTDQRAVITPATGQTSTILGIALRYVSSGNAYLIEYIISGISASLAFFTINGGSPSSGGAGSGGSVVMSYDDTHQYTLDCQAVGTNPTTISCTVTDVTTSTVLGTGSITDSTSQFQVTGLQFGLNANGTAYYSEFAGYGTTPSSPVLTVSPTSGSVVDASTTLSITPTLSGSSASLTSSVSGGGTISGGGSAISGTPITYTPPISGSGTATVTVTDATDSLTATCTVTYGPGVTISISPSSAPLGVLTSVTMTGSLTSWLSTTKPVITGGTNPGWSNLVVNTGAQTMTFNLNPGLSTGTLTLGDTADSVTTTIAASSAVIVGNIVFHGDSLTYGTNASSGGGTVTGTVYPAVVMMALGPTWQGTNEGHSGHTVAQYITEGSTIDGLYDATKTHNVLCVLGGHNDFAGGTTVSSLFALWTTYLAARKAAGWKIVYLMEPPAANAVYPSNFDVSAASINAMMRTSAITLGASAIASIDKDIRIGLAGSEQNTTFYSTDLTHFTDAGYAILGQYAADAVWDAIYPDLIASFSRSGQRRRGR